MAITIKIRRHFIRIRYKKYRQHTRYAECGFTIEYKTH